MIEAIPPALRQWADANGLSDYRWLELLTPTSWDQDRDVIEANGETLLFVLEECNIRYYVGKCHSPERASVCYWLALSRQLTTTLG